MAKSPDMAGDRQGQRHRMAEGLDVSTEQNRDEWRCSVVVRACREEGTNREKKGRKIKRGKQTRTTPRSTTRRRDRKGRVARATRRPQVTRTARETAQERGAGEGWERPVLGARNGPWMNEDPVGPRHGVAGGPVGYKHGMRDGWGRRTARGIRPGPRHRGKRRGREGSDPC